MQHPTATADLASDAEYWTLRANRPDADLACPAHDRIACPMRGCEPTADRTR